MKKRAAGLLILLAVFMAIPAHAVTPRLVDVLPNISFANNRATCTVEIYADNATDEIEAEMELWQGTTKIDSWNASGVWYLSMTETASVSSGKTYKLVVNYSINDVAKTPVTIYRTND